MRHRVVDIYKGLHYTLISIQYRKAFMRIYSNHGIKTLKYSPNERQQKRVNSFFYI